MSIEWAVAIFSGGIGIMTLILGWMGSALWGIRGDLREFVTKTECSGKMTEHCAEINELHAIAKENQKDIAQLKMVVQTKHHIKIGE